MDAVAVARCGGPFGPAVYGAFWGDALWNALVGFVIAFYASVSLITYARVMRM